MEKQAEMETDGKNPLFQHASFPERMAMLNSCQLAAVKDPGPSCMVNACVGSGKTTVLTMKVQYLHDIEHVPYNRMMVLTFTNRAADEIRQRLITGPGEDTDPCACSTDRTSPAAVSPDEYDPNNEDRIKYCGTFHSVARQILFELLPEDGDGWKNSFTILEPEEELALAEELIDKNKLKIKYKNRLRKRIEQEGREWKNAVREAKRQVIIPQMPVSRYKDDIYQLIDLLEKEKKAQNCMSFDNLMEEIEDVLRQKKDEMIRGSSCEFVFPLWLIVDEVQDCSRSQLEMLRLLKGPDTRFFAVGDPNQMIYSFRGGDISLFYQIKDSFGAKELELPVNYRSSGQILNLANRFRQYGRKITGEETSGQKIPLRNYYDAFQAAEMIGQRMQELHEEGMPYHQMALLYRLKEQEKLFADTFTRLGIYHNMPEKITLESTEFPKADEAGDSVNLLTLHASKGLEFDAVFLVGLNKGLIPLAGGDAAQEEEEQRLFFVGMTRAKKILELSWYTDPALHMAAGEQSPFLKRIPEELLEADHVPTAEERARNLQNLRKMVQEEIRKRPESERTDSRKDSCRSAENPASQEQRTAAVTTIDTENQENGAEAVSARRASHPRYGCGIITAEDDMTIEVDFPGYGKKEFVKMFGEVTILD